MGAERGSVARIGCCLHDVLGGQSCALLFLFWGMHWGSNTRPSYRGEGERERTQGMSMHHKWYSVHTQKKRIQSHSEKWERVWIGLLVWSRIWDQDDEADLSMWIVDILSIWALPIVIKPPLHHLKLPYLCTHVISKGSNQQVSIMHIRHHSKEYFSCRYIINVDMLKARIQRLPSTSIVKSLPA